MLYGCTNFCLPIHQLMDIRVVSTLGQLWTILRGFPGGSDSKELACNVGDLRSIPESRRSPGEGNGSPLQYSCLENPMDRGAGWSTVLRVTQSWTWLKWMNGMDNTVLKIPVQVCVWTYGFVLLAISIGVELLGHMVTLCLTFWETAKLLSKVVAIFYISTSSARGFSASLLTLVIIWPLIIVLPVRVSWYLTVVFHLPKTNDIEHLFGFLLPTCIYLWNNVDLNLCPL